MRERERERESARAFAYEWCVGFIAHGESHGDFAVCGPHVNDTNNNTHINSYILHIIPGVYQGPFAVYISAPFVNVSLTYV